MKLYSEVVLFSPCLPEVEESHIVKILSWPFSVSLATFGIFSHSTYSDTSGIFLILHLASGHFLSHHSWVVFLTPGLIILTPHFFLFQYIYESCIFIDPFQVVVLFNQWSCSSNQFNLNSLHYFTSFFVQFA